MATFQPNNLSRMPAPQPLNIFDYCPVCCKQYGIIFVRRKQCKCCLRYFCSNCIGESKNKFCTLCEKHNNEHLTCISVYATYFIDGSDQTKMIAFANFTYYSNSRYTIFELVNGGIIPAMMFLLKFPEYQPTLIQIFVLGIKADSRTRIMFDTQAFLELSKMTKLHEEILFILGNVVVGSMKGATDKPNRTMEEVVESLTKAREFVENENYQINDYRKEFIEVKENREGEFVERVMEQFVSDSMLSMLHVLYKENEKYRNVVEVMYRFIACGIEMTKTKLNESACRNLVKMIDRDNLSSLIIVIIAASKTQKSVVPFLENGILEKMDSLMDEYDKTNHMAIVEIVKLIKAHWSVFLKLTTSPIFIQILVKLVKEEEAAQIAAASILEFIVDNKDIPKYQLCELMIEEHPDVIEILLNSAVRSKKVVGLKLSKVMLNTYGDEASVVFLSRGIIDSLIMLSRTDFELMSRCYKVLQTAARYHTELVDYYIQTSFICTLFVNMKNAPLQSLVAINELIENNNVKTEILQTPENIEMLISLLTSDDGKVLHEVLHLLNTLYKNEDVVKKTKTNIMPLLLPLFKKLPIHSFAILLQLICSIISVVGMEERDASLFVNSSILFLEQQKNLSLLQSVYTSFAIAVKTPQIRDVFIHGDSNDIEADGYFSYLVCCFVAEKSLVLKAAQLQFFTQFIIKKDKDNLMALDVLQPLITYILQAQSVLPTNDPFVAETLLYLAAVISIDNGNATTVIYTSGILDIFIQLTTKWKATKTGLMEKFVGFVDILFEQIPSIFSEHPKLAMAIPEFLGYSALSLDTVKVIVRLINEMKMVNLPIIFPPSGVHTLIIASKKNPEVRVFELIQSNSNFEVALHKDVDLLLHSTLPEMRNLGFLVAKQQFDEKVIDGALTLMWEELGKDELVELLDLLYSCSVGDFKEYLVCHKLVVPFVKFLSESADLFGERTVLSLFRFLDKIPVTPYHITLVKQHGRPFTKSVVNIIEKIPICFLKEEKEWLFDCVRERLDEDAYRVIKHLVSNKECETYLMGMTDVVIELVENMPKTLDVLIRIRNVDLQPLVLLSTDVHSMIQQDGRALRLLVPFTWYSMDYVDDAKELLIEGRNVEDAIFFFVYMMDREEMYKRKEDVINEILPFVKHFALGGGVGGKELLMKIINGVPMENEKMSVDSMFEEAAMKKDYEMCKVVCEMILKGFKFSIDKHKESIQLCVKEVPALLIIATKYYDQMIVGITTDTVEEAIKKCSKKKLFEDNLVGFILNCLKNKEYKTVVKKLADNGTFKGNIENNVLFGFIQSNL
ncbi:hypothetical protein EIN_098470 [Entamoeba invadens IP1]|uniref:FYVE-type domain-containing protein n=1 Tax=Entamoeba invadens IP1 TaxID=370355 RepID=A0A0A1U0U1_ENTIV|nr:hypothetical protein EIN_098470 [Entamoeba invadens IP1]ELP87520.1 hypothetical protein EIN_098470 [Entamoeba invadens IP1]|eukprot:XP_004254291.1 hypothetical protein EIN_098470 [Entamoeba invadens IP1]